MTKPRDLAQVRAAGKLGGDAFKAKYGREGYQKLGRQGGELIREERGQEHFVDMGRKGGQAIAAKGPEHMKALGKKGHAARQAKKDAATWNEAIEAALKEANTEADRALRAGDNFPGYNASVQIAARIRGLRR